MDMTLCLDERLCEQDTVSPVYFILVSLSAWLKNVLPYSAFCHLPIATRIPCVVHFLVSVLVLLLEGEWACMVSTLVLHKLEKVEKPSVATVFVALFWFVATFELLCSFKDFRRRWLPTVSLLILIAGIRKRIISFVDRPDSDMFCIVCFGHGRHLDLARGLRSCS